MTVLPLYAFVAGDTMGLVVLGRPEKPVADLAENLLRAASVRVKRRGSFRIMHDDRVLDLQATLGTQGLRLLDRIDLVWDEA